MNSQNDLIKKSIFKYEDVTRLSDEIIRLKMWKCESKVMNSLSLQKACTVGSLVSNMSPTDNLEDFSWTYETTSHSKEKVETKEKKPLIRQKGQYYVWWNSRSCKTN